MKQGIIHRCVLEVVDGTWLAAKLNIGLITEKVYVDQYHHHRWSYLLLKAHLRITTDSLRPYSRKMLGPVRFPENRCMKLFLAGLLA